MSRDWLAVYAALLHAPKYRRLSEGGKAALFHTWLLATNRSPEACWPDRDTLADELDLDGLDASTIDELVRLRWLDLEDDGGLSVHDWDAHQFGASKAIRDEWEAARKREWRRKSKSLSPAPPLSTDSTATAGQDSNKTVQESRTRPDAGRTRPDVTTNGMSRKEHEREMERLRALEYAAQQRRASKSATVSA